MELGGITALEGTLMLKGQDNKKKWTVSTWPPDHAGGNMTTRAFQISASALENISE